MYFCHTQVQTHFNDVFVKANYKNGEIEIENEIINGLGDGMYKISVFINNTLQDEKTFELKNSNLRINEVINTKINSHKLWSPDYPNVYDLNLKLFKLSTHSKDTLNQILDNYNEKFGFREFTVKNNKFYLNDNPIYLKAAFFEGLYPVKLSFPDSKEMMIKEILMAKEAGFNMIRPWRKPPPKEWLHLADSIGVLTVGSMAIECMDMPIESAYLPKRVENEITESILRDRNHPSIVNGNYLMR
jgi:beta-galactosidase/beta-glucuronidase